MGSEVNGNLMHIGANQNETKLLGAEKKKLPFDTPSIKHD